MRRELAGRVPLIGFAAAPFTLAAYLVEGEGSRTFGQWKRMLYAAHEVADAILEKVTATTIAYLTAQVRAGAQAIQLFDTWAGLGLGGRLRAVLASLRQARARRRPRRGRAHDLLRARRGARRRGRAHLRRRRARRRLAHSA